VLGVFSPQVVDVVSGALAELGTEHAFVVHGAGKLDEISLAGPTIMAEVRAGSVRKFAVVPEDFGKKPAPLEAIQGGNLAENAALIRDLLAGVVKTEADKARRDIVVINASAALVVAGVAGNFREGAELAEKTLGEGSAARKLEALRQYGDE
jgi:anthranilate phosphoribosyltransferase